MKNLLYLLIFCLFVFNNCLVLADNRNYNDIKSQSIEENIQPLDGYLPSSIYNLNNIEPQYLEIEGKLKRSIPIKVDMLEFLNNSIIKNAVN